MTSLTSIETALVETAAAAPMRAQVERWAAINSGTTNLPGLATLAAQLADAFAILPGDLALVPPAPVEVLSATGHAVQIERGAHLHLRVRPDAPRQILLTGHMDTVFAADHPFQSLRLIDADTLGGPGTADMKGGIAVMLAALTAFETSAGARALGYEVILNSDEETGSHASAALIAERARGKHAAFTYEPALPDGTLAGARPGSGNFSIDFRGTAAHAGRNPEEGRNALLAAADFALRLAAAISPTLKINPAKIDGGGPNNIVPDHAILRVNLRPETPDAMQQAQALLATLLDEIARVHRVTCHLHGSFNRPPKPIDAKAERLFGLVRSCGADLGLAVNWRATGGVCDGNNIHACGVPVVDTMGVRGGAIHSEQEFMIISSLAERAQLSALTIARFASGGIL